MPKIYDNVVTRDEYSPFVQALSRLSLRLLGWRCEGEAPASPKYVAIAAPHGTNWDLLFMLLGVRALGLTSVFMMKDTVFWWPLGVFWRWLGGIPVNRRASSNVIRQVVNYFDANERLRLLITPEGTRKKVKYWKLGFYWMALGAGVPILMVYVDYKKKTTGIGPLLYPTGDVEADFEKLRAFYEEKVGVTPTCRLRPGEAELMLRGLKRRDKNAQAAEEPKAPTTP